MSETPVGVVLSELSLRKNYPLEVKHLPGAIVGIRPLQPDSQFDRIGFNQLETPFVAKGIENITPDKPDTYEELKKYASGMRLDSASDSMRYTVVDITGQPVYPTEEYKRRSTMVDTKGNVRQAIVTPESHKPWEGVPVGNVIVFRDESDRVRQLGFDPDALRDPTRPAGPDNPPKKLFLELSYYHIDKLYQQFPHLQKLTSTDGKQALTAFESGIYTAIVDVVEKAKAVGYDPKDIVLIGYTNRDNERSKQVLETFGFQDYGLVQKYSEDYPFPRDSFVMTGESWHDFQHVYESILVPNTEKNVVPPHLTVKTVHESPLRIPLETLQPQGIDNTPPEQYVCKPYIETAETIKWNTDRITHATEAYTKYGVLAEETTQAIYTNILKIKPGERGVIVADSATDPAAVAALMHEADALGASLDIFVLRDKAEDDLVSVTAFLRQFENGTNIHVRPYDMLQSKTSYTRALDAYWNGYYDYGIGLMNASYDIRIKKIARMAYQQTPMIMMPGVTIESLTSPMFQTDREKMNVLGKHYQTLMKDADHVTILCPKDGTDFTYYIDKNTPWWIESELDFSSRRDPDLSNLGNRQMPVDNWGGEVYTICNLSGDRMTHGTWNVYWPDADPYFEAYARGEITKQEFQTFVSDRTDPIKLTLEHGKIVQIDGGKRADILREYLQRKSADDFLEDANLYITEPGAGLNYNARSPEQHGDEIIMTLEAEKIGHKDSHAEDPDGGMIHFGVGESFIHPKFSSNTHLDHLVAVPEGATLYQCIIKKDGSAVLLSGKDGMLNYYQSRHIPASAVSSVLADVRAGKTS